MFIDDESKCFIITLIIKHDTRAKEMKTGDTEGNQTTQCSTQKVRFQCERDLSKAYLVKAKWEKYKNGNEMPEFTFTLTSWALQDDLRKISSLRYTS